MWYLSKSKDLQERKSILHMPRQPDSTQRAASLIPELSSAIYPERL